MIIKENSLVLFQGDSVTDWGRSYEDGDSLGHGYVLFAAGLYNAMHPEMNVKFINRGIGGNRIEDLVTRWRKDCLEIQPDVVSILIGINDTWRRYDNNDPTSVEQFFAHYHFLLTETKEKLGAKIILCEPFLLPVTEEQRSIWREDLDPKIHATRELAREFNAVYVPYDGIFAAASMKQPLAYWSLDGVHPTPAGFALMGKHWLEAVEAI